MAGERITVYINGRVNTFNLDDTVTTSFAIEGDYLLAVGPESYVRSRAGDDYDVFDLQGATVIPGLIDAHVHLIDYGLMMRRTADLVGCETLGELEARLRAHALKLEAAGPGNNGKWLLGHGFDQELLPESHFPTRTDLDAIFNDRPVVITRICGHAAIANTRALEMCVTPLPAEALRTGLLTEDEVSSVMYSSPDPSDEDIDDAIMQAGSLAASLGITGVHCLLSDLRHLDRLYALHDLKELPIRFYCHFPFSELEDIARRGLRTGSGDTWLTIGAAKIFSDGAMGPRTAAMLKPFSDDPDNKGMLLVEKAELRDMIKHAQAMGFQTATHAIGDAAVETVVSAIISACAHQTNRLRHRIEHASQVTERSIIKMAHYCIPAVVQPQFVQTDFWTRQRVGPERYRWSYPFKTMINTGVPVAMSSDCYVERLDPYELIQRAWIRDEHSKNEALTPRQTFKAYTMGSAFAGHQEEDRGTIEEGKLADLVVYPEDPFALEPQDILDLRPEIVIIAGTPYQNPAIPV